MRIFIPILELHALEYATRWRVSADSRPPDCDLLHSKAGFKKELQIEQE